MGSTKKVALVTGATGIQGRALISHLSKPDSGWDEIYGVSRKPLDFENRAKRLSFDMYDMKGAKYYEDYVIERRKKGAKWTWSSLRPGCIIGYSLGFMNLLHNIGVYGTMCKELGYAFRFPGTPVAYKVLLDCVDVDLLADCQIWLATHPEAQNDFYNISNGDIFRFEQLWPVLAAWFGVEVGPSLRIPLTQFMPHHKDTWASIIKKHGLKDIPFEKMAQWEFADAIFSVPSDGFGDVTKLRKAGYEKHRLYTEEVFIHKLDTLADMKVIPRYSSKNECPSCPACPGATWTSEEGVKKLV
ncbi:3-oxo-Delta(4,5)-steroid 5-beta-reductase [Coccomyxa sp. Obi]|nr:3-oxo-Delta(4,5)-steroid 5-beta-reductase [Coccomyxa sp. Obi]